MTDYAQKLGTSRSSKPILQPVNIDSETLKDMTSGYELADHFDAYAVYQYLLARELATLGRDSPRIEVYNKVSKFHVDQIGNKELGVHMHALALTTIFDVIEFGKSLADPIFV
jgi:hypothetical protein